MRGANAELYERLQREFGLDLIASGGVLRAEDAKEKIEAGASLVQILTGFLKNGPAFVADCVDAAAEARRAAEGV